MDRRPEDADRFPAFARDPGVAVAPAPPAAARATALDALRGLAILGMVLVAAEPLFVLPAWMYHAQNPPPSHEMNTGIPGFTWPDLVFPVFMFTLGAAIPLALARRLNRGDGYAGIVASALARGALLVFFALFRQHFDSSLSGLSPRTAWIVGLAGFAVLFLIFTRVPDHWSRPLRLGARVAGWAGALAMFAFVTFPDGSRFNPERIDIILLLLAYCAAFGTVIWLATRHSILARLAVLAFIVGVRAVGYNPGWVNVVYEFDPVPWLYQFSFFQFLCAIIPGTIAGDMILRWMEGRDLVAYGPPTVPAWSGPRMMILAAVLLLSVPLVLAGIQGRYVFATTVAAAVLSVTARWLARSPGTDTEDLMQRLITWGGFWLLLGLLLDPYDGGTKKVPETFAWFFQGCGLAIFMLVALVIVTEVFQRRAAVALLVDVGQNPMMAYVGLGMFVMPLLGLTTAIDFIQMDLPPLWALGRSVVLVLLVAFTVRFFTRRRIMWRT